MGMKRWLLRIAVLLSALAVLSVGSWWMWRKWYAAKQLQAAITADDVPQVKFLIRFGAPVDAINLNFVPPIHFAVGISRSDIAEILLAHGVKVDAKDSFGWTPLHGAVIHGNRDMAELLLAHGAKVDAKNYKSVTSLHLAVGNHHYNVNIAKLLLAHGADPNSKNEEGKSPLDIWPALAEIVKKLEAEKAGKSQPAQPKVATP